MKQLLLDIAPAPKPTLANFVIGRNGEAIHALTQAMDPAATFSCIYLWGDRGSGKTHIINACTVSNNASLYCVDDVHLLDSSAQIALFDRYNQLRASGGALIATGVAAPTQMGLREDLATRLAWGLVYQLHPLTDAEKMLALKQHASERGMHLPDEVVEYCLRYLRRDLPTLMSILDALDKWSLTYKRPVTLPMLRQLVQPPQLFES